MPTSEPVSKPPEIDPTWVIQRSRANVSDRPVTTSRYLVEIVMNEADPDDDEQAQREALSNAIQAALDAGHLEDVRYDAIEFKVRSREVLDTAPPNYHKEQPCDQPPNCAIGSKS